VTQSKSSCDFAVAQDGMLRCLPTTPLSFSSGGEFTDATCTKPAAETDATTCTSLPFATATTGGGCPTTTSVYAAGAVVTNVYSGYGGSCSPLSITGPTFFAVGAEIKPSAFTLGTEQTVPGGSRILADAVTAGSLAVAAYSSGTPLLYDTARKESCVPATASDGKLRCVPLDITDIDSLAILYPGAFADAACTKPLALSRVGCKLPKYAYSVGGCGRFTATVYAVGKKTTTAYVDYGTCMSVPIPTGQLGYEVGAEVPASGFARLDEKVH